MQGLPCPASQAKRGMRNSPGSFDSVRTTLRVATMTEGSAACTWRIYEVGRGGRRSDAPFPLPPLPYPTLPLILALASAGTQGACDARVATLLDTRSAMALRAWWTVGASCACTAMAAPRASGAIARSWSSATCRGVEIVSVLEPGAKSGLRRLSRPPSVTSTEALSSRPYRKAVETDIPCGACEGSAAHPLTCGRALATENATSALPRRALYSAAN